MANGNYPIDTDLTWDGGRWWFEYKCKRCGATKKYPHGSYLRKEKGLVKFHTMGIPPGWSEHTQGREHELEYYVLCPECTDKFNKFMNMEGENNARE